MSATREVLRPMPDVELGDRHVTGPVDGLGCAASLGSTDVVFHHTEDIKVRVRPGAAIEMRPMHRLEQNPHDGFKTGRVSVQIGYASFHQQND